MSSLRPLSQRNFALVWFAALLSNIGSWMQTVAVGVLVTAKTGEAGWTGLVAAAAFIPIGLLSPVGGAMADRVDRRRWLLATTIGETLFAVALTLLAATGHATPVVVTVLVFGGGAMAAIGFPAYQAMLPDLVAKENLGAAISLSSAQFNLGRVIGPALAGLAIVAGGYSWAFAINAISFLAVVIALMIVRLPPVVATGSEPLLRRLADGARATAANPACRLAVGLIGVLALTASPFIALVPAVALKVFASKASGTSVLITAQGVGAVTGALALTPLVQRFDRRRVLVAAVVGVCVSLVAYGLSPDLAIATVSIFFVGATYIGVLAGCNTTIQLHAPPALRGRMLGIYMMALGVLYPIGALAQGSIADRVGLRAVTVGGACLLLLIAAVAIIRGLPSVLDRDLPGAPTTVDPASAVPQASGPPPPVPEPPGPWPLVPDPAAARSTS